MEAVGSPAASTVGSALDGIPIATSKRLRPVSKSVYGQGALALKYSVTKQLLLFSVVALWTFVPLTLTFICLFRGFCFAEELTGNGNGDGGARFVYSTDASRALVPVGLLLAVIFAPLTALAAHVQVLAVGLVSFFLNATACVLLAIASIASFGVLPTIPGLVSTRWPQLSTALRSRSYGNNAAAFQAEMQGDVTAVALAALTGAVLTGVVALVQYPILHAQGGAYLSARMETGPAMQGKRRAARLQALCCGVHPNAEQHDGAYGQGNLGSVFLAYVRSAVPSLFGMQPVPTPTQTAPSCWSRASGAMAPATRLLSMPAAQARASFLTFVASTCGRPGLALVSFCLPNTPGDRELLERAMAGRSTLSQAAAGSTGGLSSTGREGVALPAGSLNGSARPTTSLSNVPVGGTDQAVAQAQSQGAGEAPPGLQRA